MKSFEFCRNMWKSMKFLSNCKLIMEKKVKDPMKRFMQSVHPFLHEFCANSNIHGVRYFTERMLHWTERLWWIIAFGVSLWLCGSMIQDIWTEWNENPTTILNKKTHISMIPFPTVTICPQIKILKHKLDISSKFDEKFKTFPNLSDIETKQISALAHVCPYLGLYFQFKDDFNNESYNIIEDLAPSFENTIQKCRWRQTKINCSEYMTPMLTRHGVCFTFNSIDSLFTDKIVTRSTIAKTNRNVSGWSLENGYKKEFTESEYPVRALDSGLEGAFEIILSSNTQDYDYLCNGLDQGLMFFLSAPGDSLEMQNTFDIGFSENILVTVKPELFTTSKGLRSYKPMQQCMANFTKKECGCAKFSMPRDASTIICGGPKIKCYQDAEIQFKTSFGTLFYRDCNCLSSCTSIKYEVEIDRAKFNISNVKKAQINDTGYQETRLTIFVGENYIETKKRVERYTIIDFLAICGGLLGLFLGISALSIIELIYFWTLRLFRIVHWSRSKHKEEQSQHRENELVHDDRQSVINENFLIRATHFIRAFFTELCDDSNIHGFRYFSERMLHWSERLYWLIALGVSLWLCSTMIHKVWIQWIEDPVTMNAIEKHVSIEGVPFPTVTICPEIKTMKHKLDVTAAFNSLSNLSNIEMARLNALAHICPLLSHTILYRDNFTSESIYDVVRDIAPNIRKSIIRCAWQNNKADCSKLFTPILTDEGLCFTFNALNSHEIYTDEMASGMMIVKDNTEKNYPYQLSHKGRINYMIMLLATDSRDIEYQCRGCDKGFKLILTMPGETIDPSQNYLRLSISDRNSVVFHSKLTITSDGLRRYMPNQRQCFYNSDNPLRFFKMYTKSNCEAECLANFTRVQCGCVKFSMPRDNNTKICGSANVKCYKSARWNLFTSKGGILFHDKCNCLPSCTSIEYTARPYRTTFNHTTLASQVTTDKRQQFSILALIPKANSIEIMKRNEMYAFSDFLAVCGGVLGLFLGVSLLSIIELIYYFTLRLFWTNKMKRNRFH